VHVEPNVGAIWRNVAVAGLSMLTTVLVASVLLLEFHDVNTMELGVCRERRDLRDL
jgi:hypothetical protein